MSSAAVAIALDAETSAIRTRAEANRANSQLSTGPKTVFGKAVSSRNAATHGLTSSRVVLRDDTERSAFPLFEAALAGQIQPEGHLQNFYFQRLVTAAWNLDRCDRLHAELAFGGNGGDGDSDRDGDHHDCNDPLLDTNRAHTIRNLEIYLRRNERTLADCTRQIRELQTEILFRGNTIGIDDDSNHPSLGVLLPIGKLRKQWADDECNQTRERDAVITRKYGEKFEKAAYREDVQAQLAAADEAESRQQQQQQQQEAAQQAQSGPQTAPEQTKPPSPETAGLDAETLAHYAELNRMNAEMWGQLDPGIRHATAAKKNVGK